MGYNALPPVLGCVGGEGYGGGCVGVRGEGGHEWAYVYMPVTVQLPAVTSIFRYFGHM